MQLQQLQQQQQQQQKPEEAENICEKCSTFADLRGDPVVGAMLPLIKIHGCDLQLGRPRSADQATRRDSFS